MIEFTLPSLGSDMDEGTLHEGMIKPGDQVERGQIVTEVAPHVLTDSTSSARRGRDGSTSDTGRWSAHRGQCGACGSPANRASVQPNRSGIKGESSAITPR